MSDLEDYLSIEEIYRFHRLPTQLRLWKVTTNDIITLSPAEIAKKTNCSTSAIVSLRGSIIRALTKKELEEADRVKREIERSGKENDECYEEYLRLAPDSNSKRKSDDMLDLEEFEELHGLSDDDGVPQFMKRRKLSGTSSKVVSYQQARSLYSTPKSTLKPTYRRLFQENGQEIEEKWRTICLLESHLTRALSGGIAPGYITEVSGESGCGKTQLMMHLLLAVQLPAPIGLSKSALYLSTESSLPTGRVRQLLAEHPLLSQYPSGPHPETGTGTWPSLDNIYTQEINSLEVQERVMENSVPLLIKRKNIGLVVVDSLTGNYREAFSNPELGWKENMIRRARTMRKMGALLREYTKCGVAVVVVNQVSDRFKRDEHKRNYMPTSTAAQPTEPFQGGTLDMIEAGMDMRAINSRLLGYVPPSHSPGTEVPDEEQEFNIALQEQFFSGWGDDPYNKENMKNPWGGISWTKQLSCRIALIKQLDRTANDGSWKRWAKVVFCAWSPNSGIGLRHKAVEYKITSGGIQGCEKHYTEPRTPPAQAGDHYGMEDPAVEEAFLELERNWAHQHRDILDEKKTAKVSNHQLQTMKMQGPILMTQNPIEVRATHITFDETGQHVVNQVLSAPRLSPTSGIGNWNRKTGTASSPVVTSRRLFKDGIADTKAEGQEESNFGDAFVDDSYLPFPLKVASPDAAPAADPESSDSEDEHARNNAQKGDEGEPPPRRFGSEVPDSQAESEDDSNDEMFVEKNSAERQWETDHHVEEAAHIQIPDDADSGDAFMHPHTQQEIQAREAEKDNMREDDIGHSPSPAPPRADDISPLPVAAVKAMMSRDRSDKSKFGRPQPVFAGDKENPNPRAAKISGWVSADGDRVLEVRSEEDQAHPPDDAFAPTRPYGEAIRNQEQCPDESEEMASIPVSTQPLESKSKEERRAAKAAKKEARRARKAGKEWLATPENRRFKECMEKYPFKASQDAHATTVTDPKNKSSTAQLQGAYELMCVKRAQAHGLTIVDWPVAQTPEGEYIDVETGFLMTKKDAECVMGHGVPDSVIGAFYSTMRRAQAGEPEDHEEEGEDDKELLDPATPSRRRSLVSHKTPTHTRLRESSIPQSQLSPKSDLKNVHYPSAQPRESMQPESPQKKETRILPPKTWSQKELERKKLPPILPGALPPPLPPSTPSRPRMEAGMPSAPQSSGRKETPILPPSKLSSPAPVEAPVRVETPIRPPSSPLPIIPDVPSMKRMKKTMPGSQLRNVINLSDAIEPPQLDDDGRARSKSIEPLLQNENLARSSAPLESSPPLSMAPPSTQASRIQSLSPTKARSRYSPAQRKRSQLKETYTHSSQDIEHPQEGHHRSDFDDISQEDPPAPHPPCDPPILPGMKPVKPLPVYKTPKHSHRRKPPVTPATPLRPDQLPKEDDIDYDALFPSQGESQESPQKEKQVFITKHGVKYPASKPGKDFYAAAKSNKEVVYPSTKGQRDAEEAERLRAEVPAVKKKVVFVYPPTKALRDTDDEEQRDEGEEMASILNFAALGMPKKTQGQGFLPLTSSPQRPWVMPVAEREKHLKSAPAKIFHATSVENATINALTVSRKPKYASRPSKKWQEVQKELFTGLPPQGSYETMILSSQPESVAEAEEDDGETPMHIDVVRTPTSDQKAAQEYETTASDDEYGLDAEMLEAMHEVVVHETAPDTVQQKRARDQDSLQEEHYESASKKKVRREEKLEYSRAEAAKEAGMPPTMSSHRARAQSTVSRETNTNLPLPTPSKERTNALFEKVKTAKASGVPYPPPPPPLPFSADYVSDYVDGRGIYRPPSSQHGGPSHDFLSLQHRGGAEREMGTTTQDRRGGRTWRPDYGDGSDYGDRKEVPMPSIERDEEDVVWERKALKEQTEREMREREEREKENVAKGRVDPGWLYREQEKEEAGMAYDEVMGLEDGDL